MQGSSRRICFIGAHYYKYAVGGAEVQMYLLGKLFAAHGWDAHYVTTDPDIPDKDESIRLHRFNSRPKRGRYRRFGEILSGIDADVYYQRGRTEFTWLTGRYARDTGKPFVYAVSMDIDTGRDKELSRLQSSPNPLKMVKRYLDGWIRDRRSLAGMKSARLVLAQSESQQQAIRENINLESFIIKKVQDIPQDDPVKSRPPVVLWLANLKKWKQPELFLQLAQALSGLDCRFVMAGDMRDRSYEAEVRAFQQSHRNFSYLGGVSYEESNRLIGEASVFVNTSRNYESSPNTYIQSWLRRTPVVSLHHDPDNMIEDQGLGFHSRTFSQLVEDVRKLVIDTSLRTKIGVRAREYAEAEYGGEQNFTLLRQLIERHL